MWKAIPDWPYEVSKLGQVRRIGQKHPLIPMWCGHKRKQYAVVRLCRAGQYKDCRVHVLVLEAFIGPRPPGRLALHENDDSQNNALPNLYWGTHKDNAADARFTNSKLTREQADSIRIRRTIGDRGADLAREFGVSQQLVCDIYKGRSYP